MSDTVTIDDASPKQIIPQIKHNETLSDASAGCKAMHVVADAAFEVGV